MLYLLSEFENIRKFWVEEFGKEYGVEIVMNKERWYENVTFSSSDILILDLDLFGDVGEVLTYYNETSKYVKVIAILEEPKLAHGVYLIKKGFKSYLGKKTPKIIVEQAINTVKNGNVWIYPELMSYIIKTISGESNEFNYEILEKLSPKEQEVAKYVAQGYSNKEIAKELDVQLITVKKHLSSIFEKLGIKDRVSLAILLNRN